MPYLKASFFVVMKVMDYLEELWRREQTEPVGGRRGRCAGTCLWVFFWSDRCPSFSRRESWQNGENSCQCKRIVFSTKDYDNIPC